MNNNEACAKYFKENPVFDRCFREFKRKWESYGRSAGTIVLAEPTEEERRAIEGIIGRVFYEDVVRFPLTEFEKGVQSTKYAPVDFKEMLEAYFGSKIMTTQEKRAHEEWEKNGFFETVKQCLEAESGKGKVAVLWIQKMVSEKKYGYQIVVREYRRDKNQAGKLLKTVGKAIDELEGAVKTEMECPLAVFAAEMSGNPHYFDQGTTAGQLLIHGLCFGKRVDYPGNAHAWRALLLSHGIVPDNISSIVHIYGMRIQIKGAWPPHLMHFAA